MNPQPPTINDQLPTTRGWVSKFFVHYRGRKLGPYYARCWKENNKQKREYIKPADLERVRAACQRYRDHRRAITDTTRDFYTLTGNLNYVERMARRLTKGFLRPEDYNFIEKIKDNGFHTPGRPKLRRKLFAPSPEPKAQSPKFMYPSLINVCHPTFSDCHPSSIKGCHPERVPESRDLTVTTSCSSFTTKAQPTRSRRELQRLRARLLKPMQDKLAAETPVEKLIRWNKEIKARPRPRPNIDRVLPSWITKEQVAADVQRVREAFSKRK